MNKIIDKDKIKYGSLREEVTLLLKVISASGNILVARDEEQDLTFNIRIDEFHEADEFYADDKILVRGLLLVKDELPCLIPSTYVAVAYSERDEAYPSKSSYYTKEDLERLINEIKNEQLKELTRKLTLNNPRFLVVSGSPGGNHNRNIGGLLNHSCSVCIISKNIASMYPVVLDSDIIIAGSLLHDIGKLLTADEHDPLKLRNGVDGADHKVLGVNIFIKEAENFDIPKVYYRRIRDIIRYHHDFQATMVGSSLEPHRFIISRADSISAVFGHGTLYDKDIRLDCAIKDKTGVCLI